MTTVTARASAAASADVVARVHGSIRVRPRVIDKVLRELSAASIGVPRTDVHVEVTEWGSGIAVRIETPLPVPGLEDADAMSATVPVLDRVRLLQAELADAFARLTGRAVSRVSFVITGALVQNRKRVR